VWGVPSISATFLVASWSPRLRVLSLRHEICRLRAGLYTILCRAMFHERHQIVFDLLPEYDCESGAVQSRFGSFLTFLLRFSEFSLNWRGCEDRGVLYFYFKDELIFVLAFLHESFYSISAGFWEGWMLLVKGERLLGCGVYKRSSIIRIYASPITALQRMTLLDTEDVDINLRATHPGRWVRIGDRLISH
jgi:hypothetical protein